MAIQIRWVDTREKLRQEAEERKRRVAAEKRLMELAMRRRKIHEGRPGKEGWAKQTACETKTSI